MDQMAKKEIKIFCWNVNGIRAIWKKDFPKWFKKTSPDILCLQETKAQPDQLDDEVKKYCGCWSEFFSAEKKGYSGVATYSKIAPVDFKKGLGNPYFDNEGRVLQTDFKDFSIYNVYFPNGGRGPERVKYKLDFYNELFFNVEKKRKKQKNIIICGDYNTAHKEIDLARPKENSKNTGFLPEERAWIDTIINMGYIDIFREYNQKPEQYTYWDQITRARERNVGWRIDYFMITKEMRSMVTDAKIHPKVMGSDHCPIELDIKV
ncbi:MAG TPA: exodeoxyribonuclease III [Ignavibacteria bacterium]|nr:exodeoxyribonuclease III [Ignavibacteria bacterium]HMQ97598.1 exodeoxyribonuclease III [Ignavibacteria bacterium]